MDTPKARPAPPPRPLAAAALALALGAWLGLECGPLVASLAGGALACLCLLPAVRRRARLGAPPLGYAAPIACGALFALAGARASVAQASQPPPSSEALAAGPLLDLREGSETGLLDGAGSDQPLIGRWRARGSRGWIEPARGDPPGVLIELDAPPPEGTWIAVLPGPEVLPWPSGPVSGPLAREGRFRGLVRVAPDEWLALRPPEPRGIFDLLSRAVAPPLAELRAALARRLGEYTARTRLGDGPWRGLGEALLLGERRNLDPELTDLFTRTGMLHVLAVSGLNVALLAGLAARVAQQLPAPGGPRLALAGALASVALLLFYIPVAGGAAPVSRAALMLAIGRLAPTAVGGGRRADGLTLLGAAYVIEALCTPDAPARPEVQLSYLATLALVLAPRAGARRPGGALTTGATTLVSACTRRLARLARQGLVASAAATLATAPVVAASFGEIAPLGLVVTPASVPALGLLLGGLVAGTLAPALTPALVVDLPAGFLIALLRAADALPGTPLPVPERPAWMLAAAGVGGLAAWRAGGRGARIPIALAGILALPWAPRPARLEIVQLAVGHGSCALARGPGLEALVIDAGSRDRPRLVGEALAPLLARWDVRHPWVAVTHGHRDHTSGLGWLIERYPPRRVLGALAARTAERLPHASEQLDVRPAGAVRVEAGPELAVTLVRGSDAPGNEGSRGVVLEGRAATAVLLGDAEDFGLAQMIRCGLPPGPIELLLFPHHGSDTPWLGALLEHLKPAEVWISCAAEPAAGPELSRRGVRWRHTEGACFLRFGAASPAR